jgi:hypothetical protein
MKMADDQRIGRYDNGGEMSMQAANNHPVKACILLSVFLMLAWTASAHAQDHLRFGVVGLAYNGEYNDNIFSDSDNEKSDYIHTITPSIKLMFPGTNPGNYLKARYGVDIVRYDDYSDTDYEDHKVFAGFGYRSPAGIYLMADDFYQNTADPYGGDNTYNEGIQTERWNNTINMTVGYDFADKYTVEASGRGFVERYDRKEDKYQDRTRITVGGMALYRFNKLQLLGELRWADVKFDEQDDGHDEWDDNNSQNHTMTEALFGFRFQPGGKIVGNAKIGYQTVSFENDEDKNGNNYSDDPEIIFEADVNYFLSERTSFKVFGGRTRNTSVTAGNAGDVSSSYMDMFGGVGVTQKIMNKFSLNIEYERNVEDYLDVRSGNDDKLLIKNTVRGGFDYDINDLLGAGLTLSYEDKKSDTNQYDDEEYTVTRYGFYIELTY